MTEHNVNVNYGCGCFTIIVGVAIAYAIIKWASLGFPAFWQ